MTGFWTLFFVVTSLGASTATEDALHKNGDVTLAALVQTKLWQNGMCGQRQPELVEEVEAIRWFVETLNKGNFIPGVTIGLEVLETCGNEERATRQLLNLLESFSPQSNATLIGVLGPSLSSSTAYVTRVLGALPRSERPPLVSFSATAAQLTNYTGATPTGNFFRVIPPDSVQVDVMVELLKTLQWNYVAVVFEDSLYGREGAGSLRQQLQNTGTACVAVYEAIPLSGSDIISKINSIVSTIKSEQIAGVVLFSTIGTARDVFRQAEKEGVRGVTFVLSEAVSLQPSRLNDMNLANNALVTSPSYYQHPGFAEHWNELISNQSARTLMSDINPFLAGVDLSALAGQQQSSFVHYAMEGVLVLADAYRRLHAARCQGNPGLCSSLRQAGLQDIVDQVHKTNLSLNLESLTPDQSGIHLTFDATGEAVWSSPRVHSVYQVFQFRQDQSSFVKVGDYQPGALTLNGQRVVSLAQCPNSTQCTRCLTSHLSEAVLLVAGDHYIVVVVPIHEAKEGQPLQCGQFLPKISADLAEAAHFAITQINLRKNNLFKDRLSGTLGVLVINSCNSPLVLERTLIALHDGTLSLGGGRTSRELSGKIVGYVGAMGTALSLPMATVLTRLGFVQISYASTGVSLSNRAVYKYFMRLVTPDDQQAEAVLSVVTKLSSNYIQIIYSTEPYGQGGRNAIVEKARSRGVCVANDIAVDGTEESYNRIKDELLKHPSAKLVVLFVRTHMVIEVLQRLRDANVLTQFSWIGSETWGRRTDLLSVVGTVGAVTLVQEAPLLPELETHIRSQNLSTTPDPWLRKYVEERLGCYLPGSFNRASGKACGDPWSRFPQAQYIQDAWAPYLVYSVYALALGWDAALRAVCHTSSQATPCPELTPDRLVEYVQRVRLDLRERGQFEKVFDDNGDGTGGYGVVQVVRMDGSLIYNQVGDWRSNTGLVTSLTQQVNSTCPNQITCRQCFPEAGGLGSTDEDKGDPLRIAVACLSVALGIVVIVLIVSVVCLVRARNKATDAVSSPLYFYNDIDPPNVPPPRPCGQSSSGSRGSDGSYISPRYEPHSEGRFQPSRGQDNPQTQELEADGSP